MRTRAYAPVARARPWASRAFGFACLFACVLAVCLFLCLFVCLVLCWLVGFSLHRAPVVGSRLRGRPIADTPKAELPFDCGNFPSTGAAVVLCASLAAAWFALGNAAPHADDGFELEQYALRCAALRGSLAARSYRCAIVPI